MRDGAEKTLPPAPVVKRFLLPQLRDSGGIMTTPPDRKASPARPPVRRSGPARRVKAVIAVMGLMFAIHLPAVQRWLSPMLERAASSVAGGALTFTTLEFQLWTGHVRAKGIRLVRPGLEMTSAAVDFQFRPLRGAVVRALEPRIVVTLVSDARADGSSDQQPWTVLDRFAEIEITRGALRLQDREGFPCSRSAASKPTRRARGAW